MINFEFKKLQERELKAKIWKYGSAIEKAEAAAVSDTTKQLRTRASVMIRETLNLTKKRVDAGIQRIMINRLHGGIRIKHHPHISLRHFKPKQTKAGVTYKVHKGGAPTLIPSAFGPKITKLHKSVYVRNSKSRFPIHIKKYWSLAQDFRSQGMISRAMREASDLLRNNLKRRLNLMRLRAEGKVK